MSHKVRRAMRMAVVVTTLMGSLAAASAAAPVDAPQRFIVVLQPGSGDVAVEAGDLAIRHRGTVDQLFRTAVRGFTATMSLADAEALAADPRVRYVEPDRVRSISVQTVPTGIQRVFADVNAAIDIDGSDDFRVDVDVAIIDTGVDFEHPDLDVVGGVDCTGRDGCVTGGDDDHYHGTHVAGTVAALDNDFGVVGVAPGARIWAVKVLNRRGFGSTSTIVAGLDWVAANADTIEVANMSLGGFGFSQAEYDAVQGAVDAGVAFAVAAGNDSSDAALYSPAGFDNVLTVSAIADFDGAPGALGGPFCDVDQDDTLAWYSNFGSAVDIAAPGSCILSTFPVEQGSYGTIGGTSMASPHVAGALALLASADNPNSAADVEALYGQVTAAGNFGWVDDSGDGILEPLLDVTGFVPVLVSTGGGGDLAPSVSITAPATGSSFGSGEVIDFAASATDPEDGDLSGSVSWTSSLDGSIGTGAAISVALSDGTHTITASVTDSGGNTADDTITVTVGTVTSPIVLTATPTVERGRQTTVLEWTGATGRAVEIYRDGVFVRRTNNDGAYDDRLRDPVSGTVVYQVCEEGAVVCSNEAAVTY